MKLEKTYLQNYTENRYRSVSSSKVFILNPFEKSQHIFMNKIKDELFFKNSIITEIIKFSLEVNRVDFMSRYQEHNNSPSARNLHSAQVLFIYKKRIYYYDIFSREIYWVGDDESFAYSEKLYLVGFHQLKNLSRYYGEFSMYLTLLDGGHLLFNIKNILRLNEISHRQSVGGLNELSLDNICCDKNIFTSFILEIDLEQELDYEKENTLLTRKDDFDSYNYLSGTSILEQLISVYRNPPKNNWQDVEQEELKVFCSTSLQNRSSCHNMIGNYNRKNLRLEIPLSDVMQDLKRINQTLLSSNVEVAFLRKLNQDFIEIVKVDEVYQTKGNLSLILNNDHDYFDIESYGGVFVCFGKRSKTLEDGIQSYLLSVSEIMQYLSLYISEAKRGFRPMKNYDDKYLKQVLRLNKQDDINYIGSICDNNVNQLNSVIMTEGE